MADKACNIPKITLEYGSCNPVTRCCRGCWNRVKCDYICQYSFGGACKYKGGSNEPRQSD